jgi:hypothetical protein
MLAVLENQNFVTAETQLSALVPYLEFYANFTEADRLREANTVTERGRFFENLNIADTRERLANYASTLMQELVAV